MQPRWRPHVDAGASGPFIGGVSEHGHGRRTQTADRAERPIARGVPPRGGKLSCVGRTGRVAHAGAEPDRARERRDHPQRDAGPRIPRASGKPPCLGGAAAHAARAAALRGRADGGGAACARRPSGDRRHRDRRHHRTRRPLGPCGRRAVGDHPGGEPRPDPQARGGDPPHRIRQPRTGPGAGRAGPCRRNRREPRVRAAPGPHRPVDARGCELRQRDGRRSDAVRPARGAWPRHRGAPARAGHAGARHGRVRVRGLGKSGQRPGAASGAGAGQSSRHGLRGRSCADPQPFRGSRTQARHRRIPRTGGIGRGRADLHRVREQVILAFGFLSGRLSLYER